MPSRLLPLRCSCESHAQRSSPYRTSARERAQHHPLLRPHHAAAACVLCFFQDPASSPPDLLRATSEWSSIFSLARIRRSPPVQAGPPCAKTLEPPPCFMPWPAMEGRLCQAPPPSSGTTSCPDSSSAISHRLLQAAAALLPPCRGLCFLYNEQAARPAPYALTSRCCVPIECLGRPRLVLHRGPARR